MYIDAEGKKICLFSDNFLQHNEHKTFYCFDALTFFVFALNYGSHTKSPEPGSQNSSKFIEKKYTKKILS